MLTEGLLRPVSIWEIRLADRSTILASPRTVMPRSMRAWRSRSPIGGNAGPVTVGAAPLPTLVTG
ncbi:hypothetical protein Rhe02_29470 [Rhizocola hellebori]|uniref:Uncharacterized protein n=1 Tax=Rhizocola hellebori TaxID=1392758 RepID=A0A8J3Q888_9ACTN|nr:hypothetical protein Rhe02_29470 [Rhizocola hellebori]